MYFPMSAPFPTCASIWRASSVGMSPRPSNEAKKPAFAGPMPRMSFARARHGARSAPPLRASATSLEASCAFAGMLAAAQRIASARSFWRPNGAKRFWSSATAASSTFPFCAALRYRLPLFVSSHSENAPSGRMVVMLLSSFSPSARSLSAFTAWRWMLDCVMV